MWVDVLAVDFFGKMRHWEHAKDSKAFVIKNESVEGKEHTMYRLHDLYKLLTSEPLLLHLKSREIESHLPGRAP